MAIGTSSHILFIFVTLFTPSNSAYSLPFVVFHGIAYQCSSDGVSTFTELLSNWSGSQGYCIEIGNGKRDSWFMPFMDLTSIACEKVKQMSELKDGYIIIGLSQGNMVGRGVLEFCNDGPPVRVTWPRWIIKIVKNFISLAGPHAGEASIPFCGSGVLCKLVDWLIKFAIYCDFVQEYLAPAGYVKIPNTTLYKEDWIGLKTLDEAGKVKFLKVPGTHLEISLNEMESYILPYLVEENTTQLPSTLYQPSYLQKYIYRTIGPEEDFKIKLHNRS